MNYELLFPGPGAAPVRYALTGANGGFARSLLMQTRAMPALAPVALCDLDLDGLRATCASLGYPDAELVTCRTPEEVRAAAGRVALVADAALLAAAEFDILVEATGSPAHGFAMARDALTRGVHVAMVSKEVDSVAGPYLNRLAAEHGVVYTTADGDQPANLIGLVTWARVLGLEIVAAGKASEYDYVYDPASGTVAYEDRTVPGNGIGERWDLGDDVPGTLRARAEALAALPQSAVPDYCEMNVVCNSTGLVPARETLSYPLCRTTELADVFVPAQDGGILGRTGVVDVFNVLRRPDEASFGGGVFVIVRAADPGVWETLRAKGHVVGRNGRYACVYLPYHLMGVETPITLLSAVRHGRPSGAADQDVHAVMAVRTDRAFAAGETLTMGGHHHTIEGTTALLYATADAGPGTAPYYLAAGARLTGDVPAGTVLTLDHLDTDARSLRDAWQKGATA